MEATSFAESDAVLDKPPSMGADECNALSVMRMMFGEHPVVLSCWKATPEELEEINRTGRVWLAVYGLTMPPVILFGTKPFTMENHT